jgi:hypothetical protein
VSGRPAFAADTVAAMYQGHACAAADASAVGDGVVAGDPAAVPTGDAAGEQAEVSARTLSAATPARKCAHCTIG